MKKRITGLDFFNSENDCLRVDFSSIDEAGVINTIFFEIDNNEWWCTPEEFVEIYEEIRKHLPKKKQ